MAKNDYRFKNFIENVTKGDIFRIKRCILTQCNVKNTCYYKWLHGESTPSLQRREIINTIAYMFNYPKVYEYAKGYQAPKEKKCHA